MRRILALVIVAVTAVPVAAQEPEPIPSGSFLGDTIVIRPQEGSVLTWNGRRYAGEIEIRAAEGGLLVVERVGIDDYLLGIQEVPFSWEAEALKAQAVAARTFLAWTLSRGRTGAAATYGFDICATDQCQVYGGLGQVEGPDGARWESAVSSTADEILLYRGSPAQALYSSTAGPRTRSVEDVFGSSPLPYLEAVESPGETSPYVDWSVEVPGPTFQRILDDAELVDGALREVFVTTTDDGAGPWVVSIVSTGGVETMSTWSFRVQMNASARRVRPDLYPAERPDGRRYPQTILSPTYEISRDWVVGSDFTRGYVPATPVYTIDGNGWGHQVGMSQFGAQAMATEGADYAEILAHYYGGLTPEPAPEVVPDVVDVGLAWGQSTVSVSADGPYDVEGDGELLAEAVLGTWDFEADGDDVLVAAPPGFGFPPTLRGIEDRSVHRPGFVVQLFGELSSAAETRMAVFRGPELLTLTEWTIREAGDVAFVWDATVDGGAAPPGAYQVLLFARSPEGRDVVVTTVMIRP